MTADPKAGRLYRLSMFGLAAALLGFALFRLYATFTAPWWAGHWGNDLIHYLMAMERWFATGSPYAPSEVTSRFTYSEVTFLHPPISALLFMPFLVLPLALFWIIPLAVFGYAVVVWKPAPWTWPLMAGILCVYPIGAVILNGNTDMWMWASFAAGLRWGWPAAFMVMKPSLAVFGLVGVSKRWWAVTIALAALSLPLMPWWVEWLHVILNSPGTLLYSAGNVFIFAIPVIARIGRTDGPDRSWMPLGVRLGLALGRWEDRLSRHAGSLRRWHRGGADRRPV